MAKKYIPNEKEKYMCEKQKTYFKEKLVQWKNEIVKLNSKGLYSNNVDHDVIVLIRDQSKKYLRHTYIRNGDFFTFKNVPITRLYVQFKSLEFFFEDRERTVINFGEKHTFNFFYDASMEENYFKISEEEFFKP